MAMTRHRSRRRIKVAGLWLAAACYATTLWAATARAQAAPPPAVLARPVREHVMRIAAEPVALDPGRAIFVPKPKDADDSLDDSTEAAAASSKGDLVTMIAGDRLYGRITEIGADGTLRLTAPHFDGGVRIRLSALDRVAFAPTLKEPAQDVVALTNDDHVAGKVTAMDPALVTIDSPALGTLQIARKVIRSIAFAGATESLLETDFSTGSMAPFVKTRGNWTVKEGALICEASGSYSSIVAPLEQSEPVTMVLDVESLAGPNLNAHLILFADDKQNTYGRNSVFAMFTGHDFNVQYCHNGGTNSVANGRYADRSGFTKGQFRFAFDPASGKAWIWRDQRELGEWVIPFNPKTGKFVMVSTHQPMKLTAIRVLPGIVKPPESVEAAATADDTVVFKNKDHVKVKELALAAGKLSGKTSFGSLETAAENVRLITFATAGQECPRRRKGDVTVDTSSSRVTVQFQKLNDEYLLGTSDNYGTVSVVRKAIKSVRFNIYR